MAKSSTPEAVPSEAPSLPKWPPAGSRAPGSRPWRALVLVSFAVTVRCSKLVGLDVGDVVFTDQVLGGPAPYMPT